MLKGIINAKSEYSLLKSASRLETLIRTAKNYGYQFLGLADDNLYGSYKFLRDCKKADIRAVLGLKIVFSEQELYLYPENEEGFRNLRIISTFSETNKGKTEIEILQNHSKGLILVIPVTENYLDYSLEGKKDILEKRFNFLRNNFSEIFLGVFPKQGRYQKFLEKEFSYKVLPLSYVDFLQESDYELFEVIAKIEKSAFQTDKENYLKTLENLNLVFSETDFSVNMDYFLAKVFNCQYSTDNFLPIYPSNTELNSMDFLKVLAVAGLKKRLIQEVNYDYKVYQKRLDYELSVIENMHYENYFLVVWDIVKFAKNNDILVGPGRGTSGSSLVCFCLGITNINPIKYDLYFERFLNTERITSPDIDLDFPDDKRDTVLNYVKEKYGKNHLATILTFVEFGVRSSLRDAAKVKDLTGIKLTELIKRINPLLSLPGNLAENEDLRRIVESDEEIKEVVRIATKLEGLPRQTSTHAAGVILSKDSLLDKIPLTESALNGFYQTQFEADDLADLGFIKIDFLSIRNLSIIYDIIKQIDSIFNINNISLNDEKTYKLFQEAKTYGIFQFESKGIREVLKKVKPTKIEDIIAVLALYRPGPMQFIDLFVRRKNGEKFQYVHEILKPILENTFGILVYQEQIMRLLHEFAGFSLGEADVVRRAISKKDEETLRAEEEKFLNRCQKLGHSLKISAEIFAQIMLFANYGFNKSHSAAYAHVAYQMMYLKANYSNLFYSYFLTACINSEDILKEIIMEMHELGINLLAPDINKSEKAFIQEGNNIRYSLQLKHLGNTDIEGILRARKNGNYISFTDFLSRTRLQPKALESLIYGGALDCFGLTKKHMINHINAEIQGLNKHLADLLIIKDEFLPEKLRAEERSFLGVNIKYSRYANLGEISSRCLLLKDLINFLGRLNKPLLAEVLAIKIIKGKNNSTLFKVSLGDDYSSLEAIIFNYQQNAKNKLEKGHMYLFAGRLQNSKYSERQFVIEDYKEYFTNE